MGNIKTNNKNSMLDQKVIRKGLSIYKTGNSPYWYARMYVNGARRYVVRSTKETGSVSAMKSAEELLKDLSGGVELKSTPSNKQFQYFAKQLIIDQKRVAGNARSKRYSKNDEQILCRKDDGLLDYFGKINVEEITTPRMREYLNFLDDRREEPLAPSTKSKQIITLRKVLTYAYEEGVITNLPLSPKIPRKDSPRSSFTEDEYKKLLKVARQLADTGIKIRGIPLTMELYYFIVLVVHTFMRPTEGEIFNIKHEDIKELKNAESLEINCITGKTGTRVLNTTKDAVEMYNKLKKIHPDHKDSDYILFPQYNNRTTALKTVNRLFNYVLEEASFKTNSQGKTLVAYSLRHYCLRTRIRTSRGKINVFILAKNAGTSVDQLERFYINQMELSEDERKNLLIK